MIEKAQAVTTSTPAASTNQVEPPPRPNVVPKATVKARRKQTPPPRPKLIADPKTRPKEKAKASLGLTTAATLETSPEPTAEVDVVVLDFKRKSSGTQTWRCPICPAQMQLRKANRGGIFWGCTRWPECDATRQGSDPARWSEGPVNLARRKHYSMPEDMVS